MRSTAAFLAFLTALAACEPTQDLLESAPAEVTTSGADPYRLNGAPIAAASASGRLLIARVSTGGQVSVRLHSGDWRPWRELGGSISSGLSITERNGEFRIYGRGADQAIWMINYNAPADRWGEWRSLGGLFSSAPAAVVWPSGSSTIFAKGRETEIWAINEDPSTGFGGWYNLGGDVSSAPAAAVGGGILTLAARNRADGRFLVRNFDGAGWSPWTTLGAALVTAPAVVRTAERSLVVAAGADQTVWAASYEGSSWSSFTLGGVATSEPAIAVEGAVAKVVVRGAGRRLWGLDRIGAAWGLWSPLRSDLVLGDPLHAVNDGGYLSVLALSSDGGLHATTRPPNGRFGPWYTLEGGDSSVSPTPIEDPLGNPGMGWMLEEWTTRGPNYGANCRQSNPFALVDTIEVFDAWSFIERNQGVYDWSRLDESIAFWSRQGKRIILRVSTEDLGCYAPSCTGYAGWKGIPEWLKNQISTSMYSYWDNAPFEFPDYQNSTYQAALVRFLAAYGAKYRDNPVIDAVGLRGFGQWGEWHSGHNFPDEPSRISTLRWLIDQWLAPWQGKKTLVLSASYEYRTTVVPLSASLASYGEHNYGQFRTTSAFDYASTKPNLAFRRDGFEAGLFNVIKPDLDGRLLNEAFNDGRMLPNFAEFFGDYEWFRSRNASRAGLDHALAYHPNYAVLQGWTCSDPEVPGLDAARFYREQLESVVKPALMRGGLGYRFEIGPSSYTNRLGPGVSQFLVNTTWRNLSVGRATTNYGIRYYLVDAATGREAWAASYRGFDVRSLVGGASPSVRTSFPAPALPAGDYLLKVALVDASDTPAVKLAIAGRDPLGRYTLGVVRSTATGPIGLPSVGNDVLIDFGQPYGLWARRNDRDWVAVHSVSPLHMVDGDLDGDGLSDPLVDFGPPYGLWIWRNCAVWEQIHGVSARELATRDADGDGRTEYVVDFGPQYGLWEYQGSQQWRQLHGSSARHLLGARLTSTQRGDLVVDFGAAGIWSLSGQGQWTQIHGTTSDEIVAADTDGNGVDELIVDFGPVYGLWMYQNRSQWIQLHGQSPIHIVGGQFDADRRGDLVADFGPSYGLYRFENSAWRQLHGTPSELLSKVDLDRSGVEDLLVDFGPSYGLWALKNGTSWVQQHSASPASMIGMEMDGL